MLDSVFHSGLNQSVSALCRLNPVWVVLFVSLLCRISVPALTSNYRVLSRCYQVGLRIFVSVFVQRNSLALCERVSLLCRI